jgi:hypothetical protein
VPAVAGGENIGGCSCSITPYDEEGRARYPEHLPYWNHYMWPSKPANGAASLGTQPVRWHGSGCLRWQPLQWGEKAALSSVNTIFENGTVRPCGPRKHAEIWWKIQVPYLASYIRISAAMDTGSGGDLIGFSISPDGGKSRHGVYWGPPKGRLEVVVPPSATPSIRGMQEFWFRLDMSTQSPASNLRVRSMQINVGYQHNMHIQPRLVPGDNELYVQADSLDGVKLQTDWAYTHPDGERVETVELESGKRSAKTVNPKISKPDDLIMRGVTLRCLPAK